MATATIPSGATFTVNTASSLTYNGTRYEGVSEITLGDGTVKTLQALIDENGGQTYQAGDLKPCVKVEGYDPDQNNRQLFSAYSNNSFHVAKNEVASIPGGMWVEMFDFLGDKDSNYVLKMWDDAGLSSWDAGWLGFRMNYGTSEARTYTLTWVNDFYEESQPCPPSEIGVTHMHSVKLSGVFQQPAFENAGGMRHDFIPIERFRLYRTNVTASGAAVYQRVPVEPVSINTGKPGHVYVPSDPNGKIFPSTVSAYHPVTNQWLYPYAIYDNVTNDKLLEVLPSVDWNQPPYRAMSGLIAWRNGMMAAFDKNTVMICEPFRPFAWPKRYWFPLPDKVLALAIDGNALVAITDGDPFIFTGSHPANTGYEALESAPPGLPTADGTPTKAIVSCPAGVIYAAIDGLWSIAGGRIRPLARNLFTAEEWALRYRTGFDVLRLAYVDGALLGYFPGKNIDGFKLSLADADSQLVKWLPEEAPNSNKAPVCHFESPMNGRLNLVTPVSSIREAFYESEPRLPAVYWTREVPLAKPENLGAIEVRGHGGTVRLEVFDSRRSITQASAPIYDKTFTLGTTPSVGFGRLPAGYKARNYSVRLTLGANTVVRELNLASTPQELERV